MQAYLSDPALKTALLAQVAAHEAADQIVKGTYGQQNGQWRGCAIGCALHSLNLLRGQPRAKAAQRTGDHTRFPDELGIPVELAYLIDYLFECLPTTASQSWPRQVLEAIPVGSDLSVVLPTTIQWSILDPTYGWYAYAKTPDQQALVQRFASIVARDWAGETITDSAWQQLTDDLDTYLPEWAGAWARAGAWAWAGARAGAWAWAGARAGAWARGEAGAGAWAGARAGAWAWARAGAWAWARAWAEDEWYLALSRETLRVIRSVERA